MSDRMSRRGFVKRAGAAASLGLAAGEVVPTAFQSARAAGGEDDGMMWAYLLHLGYNMWGDRKRKGHPNWHATDSLRCQLPVWRDLVDMLAKAGANTVVIDVGEGMKYKSHPELAIKGSWSHDRMREELARIREKGMEPIPKLNFSATHDRWLGPYSRMLSTDTYYKVCADVIAEAIEVFDGPPLFHLGMDEETARHQSSYRHVVIRQHGLWWHDFLYLVDQVEKGGARAWIWSDYVWNHPEKFWENMPKSVLQSNWYYGTNFSDDNKMTKAYKELDAHGYDQVPTGSNWSSDRNMMLTMKYARTHIAPNRLKGLFMAPWHPTMAKDREPHEEAIKQLAAARKAYSEG